MIKIAFVGPQRKIISFEVIGKKVIYFDDLWKSGVQIYPLNHALIAKMKRGNKNIQLMAAFILDANKGKDFEEYKSCETEDDIINFIRRDCKSKGLIEIK